MKYSIRYDQGRETRVFSIGCTITPEQHDFLQKIADRSDFSYSQIMRYIVMSEITELKRGEEDDYPHKPCHSLACAYRESQAAWIEYISTRVLRCSRSATIRRCLSASMKRYAHLINDTSQYDKIILDILNRSIPVICKFKEDYNHDKL